MKSIIDESKKAIAIIAFTLALILVICVFFIAYDAVTISEFDTFSNVLNNLTTPLLTFTAIILTFLAFYVQYDFNKKQSTNEALNQYNHNFDIVIKDLDPDLYYYKYAVKYAVEEILSTYSSNKNIYLGQIRTTHFLKFFSPFYNKHTQKMSEKDNTLKFEVAPFTNLYDTIRKFITFLQNLEKEVNKLGLSEKEKLNVLFNYVIKFDIATSQEIINFLAIEIATSKHISEKKLFKEVLSMHYALNQIALDMYDDLIE